LSAPARTPLVIEAEQPAERQPDDLGLEVGLDDLVDLAHHPPFTGPAADLLLGDRRERRHCRGLLHVRAR